MKNAPLKLRYFLGMFAIMALLVGSGCASMRASSARTAYIDQMTEKHVYNKPCEQVWPSARNLLFMQGYRINNTGEGANMTLETDWSFEQTGSTSNPQTTASRYLTQAIAVGQEQCQVRFWRNERIDNRSMTSARDLGLEWRVLQEVDPGSAAQISQEAEVRANAAAQG